MAKIKLQPFFKEMHGKLGDLVFRRGPDGTTIVSRAPKRPQRRSRKAKAALKTQQERMEKAHVYARTVMADPDLCAQYQKEAVKKKRSAYSLAISDYFRNERKKEG